MTNASDCVESFVQELEMKSTSFGDVLRIKIRRYDEKPMGWSEVWEKFSESYPGKWAVQFFPPKDELVDDANVYHLYVLSSRPQGVSIKWR